MTHHTARPPVDAALKEPLSALAEQLPASMTPEMIPMMRRGGPTDVTPETIAEHREMSRSRDSKELLSS
jgi:hypothetical protein